jgi:hypothetical protein
MPELHERMKQWWRMNAIRQTMVDIERHQTNNGGE